MARELTNNERRGAHFAQQLIDELDSPVHVSYKTGSSFGAAVVCDECEESIPLDESQAEIEKFIKTHRHGPGIKESANIVVAIKAKDWHAANEAFARAMQVKVNKFLLEERAVLLLEATDLGAFQQPNGPGDTPAVSWKVEFMVGNDDKWYGNAMRYSTQEKAVTAGGRRADAWTQVRHWRVTPSSEPLNEAAPWETSGGFNKSQAYMMGQGAFHDGIQRAPVLDKHFMAESE